MSLSPAQRHSQRVAMQQQQARLEEVNTTASLHLQMQEIMEDVAVLRSLGTTAGGHAQRRGESECGGAFGGTGRGHGRFYV